jgi:hypothetical protein
MTIPLLMLPWEMTSRDHTIAGVAKSGLGSNYFQAVILFDPSRVLLPKPWFGLWHALNILNSMQLISPQCYGTVDLLILMVLSKLMVQICPFQIHGPDLPLLNQWM